MAEAEDGPPVPRVEAERHGEIVVRTTHPLVLLRPPHHELIHGGEVHNGVFEAYAWELAILDSVRDCVLRIGRPIACCHCVAVGGWSGLRKDCRYDVHLNLLCKK